jgi:hypothetical protein
MGKPEEIAGAREIDRARTAIDIVSVQARLAI